MDNKNVGLKQKFKTVISALAMMIITLGVMLSLVSCDLNDRITEKDAIRIAREDFGCNNILWLGRVGDDDLLVSVSADGETTVRKRLSRDRGAYYVFGLDKNGKEVYVVVPIYTESSLKPTVIDWPFDYTFSEILDFAGQHGYKYSDGIEGRVEEYIDESSSVGLRTYGQEALSIADAELDYCESLGGAFSELLDIKFVFEFTVQISGIWHNCTIGQIDGKLVMMEILSGDEIETLYGDEEIRNVYTYEHDI
ncbi:MAG: hypothetical protein K2I75_00920 [Clostridiales bacterium]|nr:hypothetical protein [Clostridiales bacterium]